MGSGLPNSRRAGRPGAAGPPRPLADVLRRWHLRNARACLKEGNLRHALRWGALAAQALTDQRGGRLVCTGLERLLLAVAGRLPLPPAPPARPPGPRRWLHVFTQTYPVGGHTALAARWIAADPDPAVHSVWLLAQEGAPGENLLAAARATGGQVFQAEPGADPLEQAARLREAAWAGSDVVVLHVHPHEVVASVAFGVPGGPPVLFLNHADHMFWVGGAVADQVLHIRPLAEEWTRKYRAIDRTGLLPIPLGPAAPPTPRERREARERLGIPPRAAVLLSVGNATKYPPIPGSDFVTVAEEVLRACPGACLLVVGPGEEPRWQAAAQRSGGRLRAYAARPELKPFQDAADVYLDPIPMGSLTALLEVGQRGLACVLAPRSCPYPLYAEDGALAVLDRPADLPDYLRRVRALVENPEERQRQGRMLARAVQSDHAGAGWQRYLRVVKENLPRRHQTYRAPSPPPLPGSYGYFWHRALGPPHDRESFRYWVAYPVRLGLTPRLDRPLWRALLRSCLDFTPQARSDLLETVAVLNLYRDEETVLYVDCGQGFNGLQLVIAKANPALKDFTITFNLSGYRSVRAVRWDPAEYRICRVRVHTVSCRDAAGVPRVVDPGSLTPNGVPGADGWVHFQTFDPQFVIPLEGELASVTIGGEWEFEDRRLSLAACERRMAEAVRGYEGKILELHNQLARAAAEHGRLAQAAEKVPALQGTIRDLENRLAGREKELEGMRDSWSWRLSAPVRAVGRLLRKAG